MSKANEMYIANLDFLLNYGDGTENDEIESEIFKVAWQSKEAIHYDRTIGGGFPDLEQDKSNIATGLLFVTNLLEGVYIVNQERNFDPYIVVGFSDVSIESKESGIDGDFLVSVQYKLLRDMTVSGMMSIKGV